MRTGRPPWALVLGALAVVLLGARSVPAGPGAGTRGVQASESTGPRRHLVILHTNDIHGQVEPRPATWLRMPNPPSAGGIRRVGGYVNRVRNELRGSGSELLVVDGGDWFQGTPEGALEDGRAFLAALATIGYDALCVGNHEFDHGVATLARLLGEAELPAVLANVTCPEVELPHTPAYRIVERLGMRIALVGLVSPDTPRITHPSARACAFEEPAAALRRVCGELAARDRGDVPGERVDWVLPLTHLGLEGDRELARAHPDLDLIVGGHSHTLLKEGVVEGSTHIVQAGSRASAVGRVDVWFDGEGQVVELQARIVDLYREPDAEDANRALDEALQSMLERTSEVMDTQIGRLAAPLTRAERPLSSSPAGNLIADALRERAAADVGLHNRGGIRANLYPGAITRRDVFDFVPFSNHLVVVTLSGRELEACVRRAVEGEGRRGPEVSGMLVRLRRTGEGVSLVELLVAGQPLDPERDYTVATNSFLAAGGDGYDALTLGRERRDDAILLRELIEQRFEQEEAVTPPTDERYAFVE